MILLLLVIACLSTVLPLHAAASQDPLIWATVEAQGAYIVGDAALGSKCQALPNTFEMRADGAWLPATEFDLTGNFDDDCGIHVTLSIPAVDTGLDPLIDGETLDNDIELLQKNKTKLNVEKEEVEALEKALETEKKLHEEKLKVPKPEKEVLAKKLAELKQMEELVKTLAEKKKILANRKNEVVEGRKTLQTKKDSYEEVLKIYHSDLDEYNRKNGEVDNQLKFIDAEEDRLKKLYENCKPVEEDLFFMIEEHMGERKLCS